MMRMDYRNKEMTYHYKSCDMIAKNRIEKMLFEDGNDYGYNLDSTSRREENKEEEYAKPRIVKNGEIGTKR